MKFAKENKDPEYSSFSKLLKNVDLSNLDELELRTLKQEHGYLEKLRTQRIKIEQMKRKHEDLELILQEKSAQNDKLAQIVDERGLIIQQLEDKLEEQYSRVELLQRTLKKQTEQDRYRSKNRIIEIEQENEQLRKTIKQKDLIYMTAEEEYAEKLASCKESHAQEKKSLILEFEELLRQNKTKNNDNQINELKNLIARQNKTLKMQNQRFQEMKDRNQSLSEELEYLQSEIESKGKEVREYEEKVDELTEQLESLHQRYQQQNNSNKLKNQLESIRKKVTEMTKGEIERIEFIVNEAE